MGFSSKSFAAGAVVALVLGSGTAVAATGGKFILGQANSAGKPSTLSNPNGTALVLNSKSGTPSLKVNRATKVPNLNADKLDGLDGSAMALRKGRTGLIWSMDEPQPVDYDGDMVEDERFVVAVCPSGTVATGGGAFTLRGQPVLDSYGGTFDGQGAWIVVTSDSSSSAMDFAANVTCYNPRGAAPSMLRQVAGAEPHGRAAIREAIGR
jgi:hypothetical protein